MRKQVESLMAYLKPECHVVEATTEQFVCTVKIYYLPLPPVFRPLS